MKKEYKKRVRIKGKRECRESYRIKPEKEEKKE